MWFRLRVLRQLVDRSSKGCVSPKKQWAHTPFLPTLPSRGFVPSCAQLILQVLG